MPLEKVTRKRAKTVRESYVKRLRDNYLLILRTLMHDMILSIDKDGYFVLVNDAAADFWEKTTNELIGTHYVEYLHPDDVDKVNTALQELVQKKNQANDFIIRLKSPKGYRTVAFNGVAIFDEESNYVGAQATGKDITDLLDAQENLRASEARFKYFLDNAPEPIWIQDLAGTFLDGNKRVHDITGYSKEELIGKNMLEILVPPEQVPKILEKFFPEKTGAVIGPIELNLQKKMEA